MSKNIVFEGWLTKSPPSKRIWRTKWRRRWFALRQSGELPGQYFLDYFADRNCRRLKGTINLDLCEQVDAGLHMERGNGVHAPKDRGSVFTIQTQTRIYHLEADCEADMEKWVDAICRVCGLRATDTSAIAIGPFENNMNSMPSAYQRNAPDGPGVYIPISECVTGARAQDRKTFIFDRFHIDIKTTALIKRVDESRSNYQSQPHTRQDNTDLSGNETNISDEECTPLTINENNIRPPVPPRPPKTMQARQMQMRYLVRELPRIQVTRAPEPYDDQEPSTSVRWTRRAAPASPLKSLLNSRTSDDEEEQSPGHLQRAHCSRYGGPSYQMETEEALEAGSFQDVSCEDFDGGLCPTLNVICPTSVQYCNLGTVAQPPAVDRALKPKPQPRVCITQPISANCVIYTAHPDGYSDSDDDEDEDKRHVLQYLELDLPPCSQSEDGSIVIHGKKPGEPESVYRTVDIVKTEAFNSTREDAEASRNVQE